LCEGPKAPESGEDITMDFGRPLVLDGAGDGEEVLANGLLRFCAEFEAIFVQPEGEVLLGNQNSINP
jgi:hypothetical protein